MKLPIRSFCGSAILVMCSLPFSLAQAKEVVRTFKNPKAEGKRLLAVRDIERWDRGDKYLAPIILERASRICRSYGFDQVARDSQSAPRFQTEDTLMLQSELNLFNIRNEPVLASEYPNDRPNDNEDPTGALRTFGITIRVLFTAGLTAPRNQIFSSVSCVKNPDQEPRIHQSNNKPGALEPAFTQPQDGSSGSNAIIAD